MEANVVKQTIEVEKVIGQASLQALASAETAVPGAGREVIEVLMEEASFSIDAAEAQTDRVVVDGTVYCQAVYSQGESAAARAVAAQTGVSEVVDLPGVTARSIIRVQGVVESVEAEYENGRMRFTCAITIQVQALELETVDLISQLSGVDDAQVQFAELCSSKLAAESEAQAQVRQEVALPPALDARVALMDWGQARLGQVSPDLGGVKVTGDVQAEVLIGTGVSARPVALVKVVMPFEQLVELPEWLTANVAADAQVKHLTTSVSPGSDEEEGAVLTLEAQVAVTVRADAQDCATALMDAYATGDTQIICHRQPLALATGSQAIDVQEAFRGTLLLPDGAPGAGTVLGVRVRPVISQWSAAGGATQVEGALDVKALYLTGGSEQIRAARGELPFCVTCQGEWPQEAWVRVAAAGVEAAALMSDRLEVRFALVFTGCYRLLSRVDAAQSIQQEPAPARPAGLVIHWPAPGESAWSVGKRYQLPLSRITAVNGGKEDLEVGQPIIVML